MTTLHISPGENAWEYMYNPYPVYGLFQTDKAHPLSLSLFSSRVPILFASSPPKKKRGAIICSDKHPSPPSGALICKLQKSDIPHPIPEEVWQYLREKKVKFTTPSRKESPFSSVPLGFGAEVSQAFCEEKYDPLKDLGIEAVHHVIVPYAPEVLKLIKSPEEVYAEDAPLPADLGLSYVCPWKLPAFYRLLESEPTPQRVLEVCRNDLFPSCQTLAEQVALLSLSITLTEVGSGEKIERRIGRGLLAIGRANVLFGYAFSSSGTLLSFEDLHNIVLTREPHPLPQSPPAICKIEKLIQARFYYSSRCTYPVGDRVLSYVAMDLGGGWREMILDIPSFLYAILPAEAYVVATRNTLNYRSALEAGQEGWNIQISSEQLYQFQSPDEIVSLLRQVASKRERRAYTK